MPKADDKVIEAAERLEKLQRTQRALQEAPDTPAARRMRQLNAKEVVKAQSELSLLEKAMLGVSDFMDEKLAISKSFAQAEETGLEGVNQGALDRARHILWMQNLAEKYCAVPAYALGALNEAANIFDPIKIALRDVGSNELDTDTIRESQFASLEEIPRDLKTNLFALQQMPRDREGNPIAMTPQQVSELVRRLETTPLPLSGREVAAPATFQNIFSPKKRP